MNKNFIGLSFILAGLCYGSLAKDSIYNLTLGYLVKYGWVKPPPLTAQDELSKILGRKPTILLYASILIIIGIFILWKQ